MQASEIREMNDGDIRARINELEEERFRLKFRGATENLEDPLRLRVIRRDVARLNTVLREREIAAARQSAGTATAGRASNSAPKARNRAPKARKQQER